MSASLDTSFASSASMMIRMMSPAARTSFLATYLTPPKSLTVAATTVAEKENSHYADSGHNHGAHPSRRHVNDIVDLVGRGLLATKEPCYIEYCGHRVDYRMVVNKSSVSFVTDKGVFVGRTPTSVAQHHMATATNSFKPWSGWCAIRLANHKNTPLCFFRDENM